VRITRQMGPHGIEPCFEHVITRDNGDGATSDQCGPFRIQEHAEAITRKLNREAA
jgi:hypothetical protein